MALTPPTAEPTSLQAGDTLSFTKEFSDFPANAGWTLSYRLLSRAGLTAIDIPSSADGAAFAVDIAPAVTSGWAPGDYTLYGFVTDGTDRYQVTRIDFPILPNPATSDFIDSRSYLEKVLEKLETVILDGVIREVIRYSYNGVSTEVQSMSQALDARDRIKALIAQEKAVANGKQQKILTRFVNPR